MEFKQLDRTEPISSKRVTLFTPTPVEEVRQQVVNNKKGIYVRDFEGKKRVSIYRANVKLVVLEIEGSLTDEEIYKEVKREILDGKFDYELTTEYTKIVRERIEGGIQKKKEKAEEAVYQGLNVPIHDLDLSQRTKTALSKMGIQTSDQLWSVNIWDLMLTRQLHFGRRSRNQLKAYFEKHDRKLDMTEPSSYAIRDLPKSGE